MSHKLTGKNRNHHAAWETKNGVYLIGGSGSAEKTSELLKPDGTITEGFALKDKDTMAHACAIPDQENNELILIGGGDKEARLEYMVSLDGRETCPLSTEEDLVMVVLHLFKMERR